MKIYRNETEIYDIRPEETSYQKVVHMGENILSLTFKVTKPLDFRIGDFTIFQNTKYKFKTLSNPTRISRYALEYNCTLYSPLYDLQDVLFVLEDSTGVGTLDDNIPIFGDAAFHLNYIVTCIRRVHPEWSVGDIQQTTESKNITYTDMDCLQALQHVAEEFGIEYWITGTSISIGKKKYGEPIPFSYGRNCALYELRRQNQPGRIVTALRVQGSDRNIDYTTYGNRHLLLPNKERYIYQNTDKYGTIEDRMNFPDIYPRLVHKEATDPGSVTSVRVDENGIYWLKDDYLDFDIELVEGQNLIVDFQTGQLGGLKIDANWHADTREYELIRGDYGLGQDVPADIFTPQVGDIYALSNLKMPQAYIEVAEDELYAAGLEALSQMSEQKVSYKGTINPLYFRQLGEFIETGRAVIVKDEDIVDGGVVELRIHSYTKGITTKQEFDIEITDTLYISRISRIESDIKDNKNDADQRINYGDAYTRRRWRDAKETMDLLANAQLNFSEAINPIAIQTMQLLVGDQSLQFRFVNGRLNPVEVDHTMLYNKATRMFRAGNNATHVIQHMTLSITSIAPSHATSEYKFWDIAPIAELIPDSESRYIYLRCSKTGTTGNYVLSKTSIEMEAVSGQYHFLAGILNSEFEGERSLVPMYGFTEITPGQMRVNKIINPDGTQYWDMLAKKFKIGDANSFVSWNVDRANQLAIKGTILQSGTTIQNPNGDTDYVGVDRGNWVNNVTYYPGDIVKYTDGNVYKCRVQNNGAVPSNTGYWKLMVSAGGDGNTIRNIYMRSTIQPGTPTGSSPSGWSFSPPPGLDPMWMSEATFNSQGSLVSTWSTPVRITGDEGRGYIYAYYPSDSLTPPSAPSQPGTIPSGWTAAPDFSGRRFIYQSQCIRSNGAYLAWSTPLLYARLPEDGDPGPAIVFRGKWEDITPTAFYNNAARRDVIATSWNQYYVFRGVDGETLNQGGSWTWDSKWESFGAQFSSVATDLLLAVNANVGGWIFKNERLESQSGGAYLDGKTGTVNITGSLTSNASGNRIVVDPDERSIKMLNADNKVVAILRFTTYGGRYTSFLELFNYDNAGSLLGHSLLRPGSISMYGVNDGNNPSVSISAEGGGNLGIFLNPDRLPDSAGQFANKGMVWRDGNTLKIVTN